jgi:hypothetical protein
MGKRAAARLVLDSSAVSNRAEVPPLVLADFSSIPKTGSYPPDPVIAAGPSHVLAVVNRELRIFRKDGTLLESASAAAWFDPVAPGCLPFDPRVLYDHFAGRFLMLWHHWAKQPDISYYLLSVSETSDPTGAWVSWALPGDVHGSVPSGSWADNGCLGFDSSAIYITSNQYTFATMEPTDVRIRIVPKKALYWPQPGDSVQWTDFVDAGAFCVRPSVVHDGSGPHFLLEVPNPLPYSTAVVLYRIDDPVGSPRLSKTAVPVWEYFRAPDARQPGIDYPLDVRKSYLHSEVQLVNGQIHAVHAIANPEAFSCSAIKYLRINTSSASASEDITFGAPGLWYFYPAVAVDRDENVMITFARSSPTEYPGAHVTWRRATDGPTLHASSVLQAGWADYAQVDGLGANRWGDYSGAAIDPADRQTFWLMGEYAEARNVWGTWGRSARITPFPGARVVPSLPRLDFGYVRIGEVPVRIRLVLRNGGSAPLSIAGVSTSSPLFSLIGLPALPRELATYDSLTLEVAFTPADTGAVSDELRITSNDAAGSPGVIPLEGRGIRPAGAVPGEIYVLQSDRSGTSLRIVTPGGSVEGSLPLTSPAVHAVSVADQGQQIYGVLEQNRGSSIVLLDRAEGAQYPLYSIGLKRVGALCALSADTFYCGTDTGSVYRYVSSTSTVTAVAQRKGIGFSGLVSAGPHRLWASAGMPVANDTIYSVDLATGSVTPVGRTGAFVRTTSLCRGPDGGLLALVDYALLGIDTVTGAGTFQGYVALEGLVSIASGRLMTGVGASGSDGVPLAFSLEQNYPNPFNPRTTIAYQIPTASSVKLAVFDMLGRQVALLVNERQLPGRHEVLLDAGHLSSGVYIYRLLAGARMEARRMVLLR